MKRILAVFLGFLMAYMPTIVHANGGMLATSSVVVALDQEQAKQKVENYLSRVDVQQALQAQGVSATEINQRLASLSQTELNQLSTQIEKAQAGGLLVEILLVVLIIFLIKRM